MDRNALCAFAVLGLLVLSFGCTSLFGGSEVAPSNDGTMGVGGYPSTAPAADRGNAIPEQYLDSSGRMVIKTGSAEVLVPSGTLEDRFAQLKTIVNQSGGYVYGTQYGENANQKYYYVTVKIPPSAFESMPQALAGIGDLKSVDTSTQDVSNQYVDLAVRIQNLQAEKARLLEFYNRTSNVSELLEVEREVTRVQTEIEQLTAQKIQLERQAELATMTIRVYEETPLVDRTVMVPLSSLVSVFLQAFSLAITIIVAVAGFGIPGIVALVLLFGAFILLRKIVRRKKK